MRTTPVRAPAGRSGPARRRCHHHIVRVSALGPVEGPATRDEREPRRAVAGEQPVRGQPGLRHPLDGSDPVGHDGAVGESDLHRAAGGQVREPVEGASALDAVVDVAREHRRARRGARTGPEPVPADRADVLGHRHAAPLVHARDDDGRVHPGVGHPDPDGRRRCSGPAGLRHGRGRLRGGRSCSTARGHRRCDGRSAGVRRHRRPCHEPQQGRADRQHDADGQPDQRDPPRNASHCVPSGQRRAPAYIRRADTPATASPSTELTSTQPGTPSSTERPTAPPSSRRTASCAGSTP